MGDMMTFPDTWEEFEELYHITDTEQIYTNGARLIPSFRVEQWLEHMADRKTEPQKDCKKCKNYDRCKNNRWKCCVYEPKDESTRSKMEQVEDETRLTAKCLNCANGGSYKCSKCDGEMYYKYDKGEPQLTPNYCGTCKHREVPCGDLPCDICHGYSNYEPKDEPLDKDTNVRIKDYLEYRRSCEIRANGGYADLMVEDEPQTETSTNSTKLQLTDCAWKKGEE